MYRIAGLNIDFRTEFPRQMGRAFAEYRVDDASAPDVVLDPAPWRERIKDETRQGPQAVEFYSLSVALGEQLPLFDRLQTHGVAIEYQGRSYIFSAPSGVGKSTRAFLWQKYLGPEQVAVINGDKPILWFHDNDVLACGSPWAGKEGLHRNVCAPLGGLCLLQRSPDNVICRATTAEFFDFFMQQLQMPSDGAAMVRALQLVDRLYRTVPVYILRNDMSEQGVRVCYEALTNLDFNAHRI